MKKIFGAYLEDYHYIKVIIPAYNNYNLSNIYLVGNKEKILMRVFKSEQFGNEYHIHTSFKGIISLHTDYTVEVDNKVSYNLTLGKITKTARFELENYYEGPLGVEYHENYSIFRVWTPVAKSLELVLVHKDGTEEPFYPEYRDKGLWFLKVTGDLEGVGYYYKVRINTNVHRVVDPYAITTNADGNTSYVVDYNKLYQFKNDYYHPNRSFDYVDSVICEVSVKDFTSELKVEHPSTFKGMIESLEIEGKGLNHVKDLGITHIQLMPIFTFGGVDEKDPNKYYNWGYNPVQYNVPSGLYTTNLDNPYTRINELRELVDTIHGLGMGVNMDVVYNHVYEADKFAYSVLVPGYFYLYDDQGYMSSVSGCGNDLATNRKMVHRYVVDSVYFWQNMYRIDGFRFDLMGLMAVDCINECTTMAKTINPYTMIYGEGWNMPAYLPAHTRANMENFWATPGVAYFNDSFRNNIKGNIDFHSNGYASGEFVPKEIMEDVIKGSCVNEVLFDEPYRSINYVECHDNYTFYDQLIKIHPGLTDKEYARYVLLSLGVIAFSQGIPFYHIGESGLRTKKGEDNSYNLDLSYNKLDWDRIEEFSYVSNALKDMLEIRKEYPIFRLRNANKIKKVYRFDKVNELNKKLWKKEVSFRMKDSSVELQVIFKNDFEESVFYFAPGSKLIFDGLKKTYEEISVMKLTEPGVYIIKKE